MGDLDLEGVRSFGDSLTIVALFGRDAVWVDRWGLYRLPRLQGTAALHGQS
jgi:hypothetical protein